MGHARNRLAFRRDPDDLGDPVVGLRRSLARFRTRLNRNAGSRQGNRGKLIEGKVLGEGSSSTPLKPGTRTSTVRQATTKSSQDPSRFRQALRAVAGITVTGITVTVY